MAERPFMKTPSGICRAIELVSNLRNTIKLILLKYDLCVLKKFSKVHIVILNYFPGILCNCYNM